MAAKRRKARKRKPKARKRRLDPIVREVALQVLHRVRTEPVSATRAAREAHTTLKTVRRYVGSALARTRRGRWVATPSDRLTRHVWMFTKDGKVEVAVRGSRPASRVARYMAAVDRYLRTGDTDALAEFERQGVRSRNQTYLFLTDTEALERLANAGEVSFERLYTRRA